MDKIKKFIKNENFGNKTKKYESFSLKRIFTERRMGRLHNPYIKIWPMPSYIYESWPSKAGVSLVYDVRGKEAVWRVKGTGNLNITLGRADDRNNAPLKGKKLILSFNQAVYLATWMAVLDNAIEGEENKNHKITEIIDWLKKVTQLTVKLQELDVICYFGEMHHFLSLLNNRICNKDYFVNIDINRILHERLEEVIKAKEDYVGKETHIFFGFIQAAHKEGRTFSLKGLYNRYFESIKATEEFHKKHFSLKEGKWEAYGYCKSISITDVRRYIPQFRAMLKSHPQLLQKI